MNLIDTHCHLYSEPLADDIDAVLSRAAVRGVTRVVVPAYDIPSWFDTTVLSSRPQVFAAYGLHPWLAHEAGEERAIFRTALEAQLDQHPAVAVGEIGLDTKIDTSGLEQQLPLLRLQLELAVDRDLPVILHCRGAFAELLVEVAHFGGKLRGVLHAFSRGPELGRQFIDAGLHLGLGGAITRDRARRVRKAAMTLPLERLVLETDAPSIGLDGVLPAETEPQHVADMAAVLAELRGMTVDEVAAATTTNAVGLFDLPGETGADPSPHLRRIQP